MKSNMNVLVCAKIIPEYDSLSERDWQMDESLRVNAGFVRSLINCYDESALELARRLHETPNAQIFLTALTIGGEETESFLKTLYALCYNKALRIIPDHRDLRFAPQLIAQVIAAYAQENPQDLFLLGTQSPEGDNAATPLLLAERLGIPCVTQVIRLDCISPDTIEVQSKVDGGVLTQILRLPIVLAVGDSPCSFLHVPTLRDRMKYGKTPIEHRPIRDFLPEETFSPVELLNLTRPNHSRSPIYIVDGSPTEKARILYENYLKERLKNV